MIPDQRLCCFRLLIVEPKQTLKDNTNTSSFAGGVVAHQIKEGQLTPSGGSV